MNIFTPIKLQIKAAIYTSLLTIPFLCGIVLSLRGCKNETKDNQNQLHTQILRTVSDPRASSKKETIKTPYIPSEGSVTIISKDPKKEVKDLVEFKVQNKGFTNKLGLQVGYPLGAGVDFKFLYYNRFGLNVGFLANGPVVDSTVSLSYKLDQTKIFTNLEGLVGYKLLGRTLYAGLRINL